MILRLCRCSTPQAPVVLVAAAASKGFSAAPVTGHPFIAAGNPGFSLHEGANGNAGPVKTRCKNFYQPFGAGLWGPGL